MRQDRNGAARSMKAKPSTKHPYAAIEHRVIDSPAYADLTFSARALLVQIVRQVTKPNNNGHLQATFTYMERFGFSVNTLSRATHELITHGFIYKTKSGGFHQGAAKFAVTWLSVTNTHGIFMQGFKACAWRDWQPEQKKSRTPKVRAHSLKNGELTRDTPPKSEAVTPPKSEHIELMPYRGVVSAHREKEKRARNPITSPFAIRLQTTADRGTSRLIH
jgi:hypothetical protein